MRLFPLFLVFLLPFFALSQKTVALLPMSKEFLIGSGEMFPEKKFRLNYLGKINDDVVSLVSAGSKLELKVLSESGKLKRTVEEDLTPFEGIGRYAINVSILNGQVLVFSVAMDKKQNRYILTVENFDPLSFKSVGNVKKLEEINYESRRNRGSYEFHRSPSRDKVLAFTNLPYAKEDYERYKMVVLGETAKVDWGAEVELPYPDKDFTVKDVFVDDAGDVFVVGRLFETMGVSRKERKANSVYNYHIIVYKDKGKTVKDFELKLDDKWVTDIRVDINEKDELIGSGFYSDKKNYGLRGVFFVSIDKNDLVVKQKSFKEFSFDFLTETLTEKGKEKAEKKQKKGKEPVLHNFLFKELFLREDGGVMMVAEQHYVVQRCTTDPRTGATTCTYTYYHNNIIVVGINPSGEIDWTVWIPKRQSGGSSKWLSFLPHIYKNKAYFIYNDNPDNFLKSEQELKTRPARTILKKAVVAVVSVDVNGNMERKMLMFPDKNKLYFDPWDSYQINSKTSLLSFSKKKKVKLVSITSQ